MLIIAILLSLACRIVLRKNDFNRPRVLNDFSAVDKLAEMDAKIFAIYDNWGRKVKRLCSNKTITKSDAVLE